MASPREKFQALLKKLFQFDCAELDFGIYRIMNQKRGVIEKFIEKDLLDGVAVELTTGALAQESGLAQQLAEVSVQIKENFGDEALDAEGNLAKEYQATPRGKQYLELRERASSARSSTELETEIFNHLYAFFSRYYDEGDFMSLRRYSKRDKYAIPYNGEEVHLHWANADQYYIKTGENFTDYSYKQGGWTVCFKLRNASVEHNNVKGAKRFFLPRVDDVTVDKKTCILTVPFEYRPLTSDEETRYGTKLTQNKILDEAYPKVLAAGKANQDALAALLHEKRKDAEGKPVTLLEHHFWTYTRSNTSDFFIHKDLKGFLERELDFYLKNEILNIDEIEAGGEARSPRWFQTMTTIKAIGRKIIVFLAQIEDFQKRIFEKRKFVTEVNYCITLDRIPEALYPEIIKNKAQIEEWKKLVCINDIKKELVSPGYSEPLKIDFLKANKFLVVDTKHFSEKFKDELLIAVSDIDDSLDGLIIHAENYQTLELLQDKYSGRVNCVYIDPPYNTESDEFIYKDNYKHSSWLSMMWDRLQIAFPLLSQTALFYSSIDDNEGHNLITLEKRLFGVENFLGIITWEKRTKAQNTETAKRMLQSKIEYIHSFKKSPNRQEFNLEESGVKEYPLSDKHGKYRLHEIGQMASDGIRGRGTMIFSIKGIMPKDGMQWKVGPDEITRMEELNKIVIQDGKPYILYRPEDEDQSKYVPFWSHFFDKDSYGTAEIGVNEVNKQFGLGKEFETVKPTKLMYKLLFHATAGNDLILDFFAGSGTTAHAIIDLNRNDKGSRKYILVEAGSHFDFVLMPRIKKVIYSKDWKDGKPVSRKGSSHAFKYLYLESYEDALDNISFQSQDKQDMFKLDDYVLSYMLDFETRQSETLLNIAKLDTPFDYKLKRHGKDKALSVDLPETFNYLIGLHVDSRRVLENKGNRYLVYRGKAEDRQTVIIWRTTSGWGQKEFEQDRDFVLKEKLTDGAEDVFVNTDSFISGARSLDPVFKHRMFNEE